MSSKQITPKKAALKAYIAWHANPEKVLKLSTDRLREAIAIAGFGGMFTTPWANEVEAELDKLIKLDDLDQEDVSNMLQHVPKKELLKCKPGTWLLVKWNDMPPIRVLLIEKPDNYCTGAITLTVFDPNTKNRYTDRPESDQVIAIGPYGVDMPDFNV